MDAVGTHLNPARIVSLEQETIARRPRIPVRAQAHAEAQFAIVGAQADQRARGRQRQPRAFRQLGGFDRRRRRREAGKARCSKAGKAHARQQHDHASHAMLQW